MGTNFYFYDKNERVHLGKRSAAGWYCWDCKTTLCENGAKGVHFCESKWSKVCPKCKKAIPERDVLTEGAAARELGFDKSPFKARMGVDTCSSFSWAIDPKSKEYKYLLKRTWVQPIFDEYGNKFSVRQWLKVLEECPLQFMHIGENFS